MPIEEHLPEPQQLTPEPLVQEPMQEPTQQQQPQQSQQQPMSADAAAVADTSRSPPCILPASARHGCTRGGQHGSGRCVARAACMGTRSRACTAKKSTIKAARSARACARVYAPHQVNTASVDEGAG